LFEYACACAYVCVCVRACACACTSVIVCASAVSDGRASVARSASHLGIVGVDKLVLLAEDGRKFFREAAVERDIVVRVHPLVRFGIVVVSLGPAVGSGEYGLVCGATSQKKSRRKYSQLIEKVGGVTVRRA
jgi:hypothetical protein